MKPIEYFQEILDEVVSRSGYGEKLTAEYAPWDEGNTMFVTPFDDRGKVYVNVTIADRTREEYLAIMAHEVGHLAGNRSEAEASMWAARHGFREETIHTLRTDAKKSRYGKESIFWKMLAAVEGMEIGKVAGA